MAFQDKNFKIWQTSKWLNKVILYLWENWANMRRPQLVVWQRSSASMPSSTEQPMISASAAIDLHNKSISSGPGGSLLHINTAKTAMGSHSKHQQLTFARQRTELGKKKNTNVPALGEHRGGVRLFCTLLLIFLFFLPSQQEAISQSSWRLFGSPDSEQQQQEDEGWREVTAPSASQQGPV